MKKVKLMADYGCFPLWRIDDDYSGDIDPDSLPISSKLKTDINNWAERYEETLNMDDPASSGFKSEEDAQHFYRDGEMLLHRLQNELGQEYTISYVQ